jgi:hypothetical protein
MARFIGSEDHKRLFCETFIETHKPFEPAEIPWPELEAESLARLRGLPIWDEAVKTETDTALKVQTLGGVERDPVLARAIALQGYEEGRHASVLTLLTQHYGIPVKPFARPGPPADPERAFLSTGYGECLDSFFAFGLFAIGKRSEYFPSALIDIFDPIMQEEARHILFIVNWAAYLRARASLPMKPVYELRRWGAIAGQILEHVRHAVKMGKQETGSQEGFTLNARSAFGDLSARSFLELCLSENERRLAPYDPRLLRPALVARGVRVALRFLPGHPSPPRGQSPQSAPLAEGPPSPGADSA